MDTTQIVKILTANPQTKRVFQGCFPCDRLPDPLNLRFPAAFVVNLDTHRMEGSHWISIYAEGLQREVIYFDSLALPTSKIIEENFLKKFPRIIRNTKPFQSPFANTCAHYCIFLIYKLSQGHLFNQILSLLEKISNTDMFVKLFVNKLIG